MAKLDHIIVIQKAPFDGKQEIRLDWDNERHQAIDVGGGTSSEVIEAVEELLITLKHERFNGNI